MGARPVTAARLGSAIWGAALVAVLPAALAQTATACPPAGQAYERLIASDAEVAYRWDPAPLKVGQFFSADIIACRSPGPVTRIGVDATMPAHGHGMNYRPKAVEVAPGHYRFSGLMLHMPGRWQITVDLYDGTRLVRRLTRDLDLKP